MWCVYVQIYLNIKLHTVTLLSVYLVPDVLPSVLYFLAHSVSKQPYSIFFSFIIEKSEVQGGELAQGDRYVCGMSVYSLTGNPYNA